MLLRVLSCVTPKAVTSVCQRCCCFYAHAACLIHSSHIFYLSLSLLYPFLLQRHCVPCNAPTVFSHLATSASLVSLPSHAPSLSSYLYSIHCILFVNGYNKDIGTNFSLRPHLCHLLQTCHASILPSLHFAHVPFGWLSLLYLSEIIVPCTDRLHNLTLEPLLSHSSVHLSH